MKPLIATLFVLAMTSCGPSTEKNDTPVTPVSGKESADFNVATTFINDYVRFLSGSFNGIADTTQDNWVMQHPL